MSICMYLCMNGRVCVFWVFFCFFVFVFLHHGNDFLISLSVLGPQRACLL